MSAPLGDHPPNAIHRCLECPKTLAELAGSIIAGGIRVVDLTAPLQPATPMIKLPPRFAPSKPFSLEEISRYD